MLLNQLLAIEKGTKTRVYSFLTDLNKLVQKKDLFSGFTKAYMKLKEEDLDYPGEKQLVQMSVEQSIEELTTNMVEIIDLECSKDITNTQAFADILLPDGTIISKIPVTHLLFLEKQIDDLRTFIKNLPTLDPSEIWEYDKISGVFKTGITETQRTKKVLKSLTKYEATKEHPAQTEVYKEDVLVGFWGVTKMSGAMLIKDKKNMLVKIEYFAKAVKLAREQANLAVVVERKIGQEIFDFLFK